MINCGFKGIAMFILFTVMLFQTLLVFRLDFENKLVWTSPVIEKA